MGANAVAKLFLSCVMEDIRLEISLLVDPEYCARFLKPSTTALLILPNSAYNVRILKPYLTRFFRLNVVLFADLWIPNIPVVIFTSPFKIGLPTSFPRLTDAFAAKEAMFLIPFAAVFSIPPDSILTPKPRDWNPCLTLSSVPP